MEWRASCLPLSGESKPPAMRVVIDLEHLTKSCSHVGIEEFLVKQPVRFEPRAYFPWWRVLREYSTGE